MVDEARDEADDRPTSSVSATWALVGKDWTPNPQIDSRDGVIVGIKPRTNPSNSRFGGTSHPSKGADTATAQASASSTLLIPGIHNAHSHAFQWRMRGRSHSASATHDDFWSWRQQMYALATTVEPPDVEEIATELYAAMVASGYVSVGEFHYLHHQTDGSHYQPNTAMCHALVRAARSAGIRLTLLPTAYARGGFQQAASDAQRRFLFSTADAYIAFVRQLRGELAGDPLVRVGYAAHSVRAVPADWLRAIAAAAAEDGSAVHVHAAEQPRELDECIQEHGLSPIALLSQTGFLSARATVVHGTHVSADDIRLIAASGAGVCICPTTERDLGDGLGPVGDYLRSGVPLSVGSDSNAIVDAKLEVALLELNERLRQRVRNALALPRQGVARPSQTVLRAGAEGGARALGWNSGSLAVGMNADCIRLHVDESITCAAHAWDAVDRWLFASHGPSVDGVWIAGQRRFMR